PAAGVHREEPVERGRADRRQRPPEAVSAAGLERVGQPSGGVVHQYVHGTEIPFGLIEELARYLRVGQVSLDGAGRPARLGDRREHGRGVPRAVDPVRLGRPGIRRVLHPQVGNQDRRAAGGEGHRGRRPDAMIRAGHDGHPAGQDLVVEGTAAWISHVRSYWSQCGGRSDRSRSSSSGSGASPQPTPVSSWLCSGSSGLSSWSFLSALSFLPGDRGRMIHAYPAAGSSARTLPTNVSVSSAAANRYAMRWIAAVCACSADSAPMACDAHASASTMTLKPVMLSPSTVVWTQIGVVSPPTTTVSAPRARSCAGRSLDSTAENVVLYTTRSPSAIRSG